jgi:hypothetical protein
MFYLFGTGSMTTGLPQFGEFGPGPLLVVYDIHDAMEATGRRFQGHRRSDSNGPTQPGDRL